MKNQLSKIKLAIAALTAYPALAFALPPNTSPYYTDVTNSYVQDQTSEVMSSLNNILCYMGAMAPSQMVGLDDYIALIDQNVCESRGSGGQSGNTGPAYTATVVNSTRASNSAPMLVKAWVEPQPGNNIKVYASASQAPDTTLPYGVFRMDYCGNQGSATDCAADKGFINASTNGLTFYSAGTHGADSEATALLLNAVGTGITATGSGAISQTRTGGGGGTSNFLFAFNLNNFVRNDQSGSGDQCFSRDPAIADESVWRYGLYDITTGAHITRNSGFPIEYTTGGITYNGYIGYYGLWMPVTVPSGASVNQVTYSNSGATKTPYTILKTGGKLTKYTTATKTLAALNKVTFWYYAQNNVGSVMTAGSQYELYWDDTAKQFYVSGMQNVSTNNMEPLTPAAVVNADMVTANQWGLYGWSQMMGGQFGITGNDLAALTGGSPSTIPVKTQTQDVVYPNQFASIIGGLTCINDCPTVASIGSGSLDNQGWNQIASTSFVNYTLNGTTGNLIDSTIADVVSTATTGTFANGVRSGRLVTPADATAMISAKDASGVCGGTSPGTCTAFNQGDIDFLPVGSSYYVWETGGNPWNQIALLMSGSTPVTFEAPLQVSFTVPNTSKYGSYAGANISLQYGGFGDLWGIPNECIDISTNSACVFTGGSPTASNNQRWTSKFSIPFDTAAGVVTGTATYLVKPLDKEIRLAKVACAGTGLATAGLSSTGLPTSVNWVDPSASVGAKPTVTTAPRVIHGVKQY